MKWSEELKLLKLPTKFPRYHVSLRVLRYGCCFLIQFLAENSNLALNCLTFSNGSFLNLLDLVDSVYKLADAHVKRYIERGFTSLMISFGCTGGQHRSVYSAQHLAEHLHKKFGIEVHVTHREQNIAQVFEAEKRNDDK